MIAKPKWFKPRKYGGWGVSPDSWQGWVYILVIILSLAVFQAIPNWSNQTRIIFTGAWLLFLAIDVVDVMIRLPKDERQMKHKSLAERNAAWFMVMAITGGLVYQILNSALQDEINFDPFLAFALFGGALVKTLTNWWLRDK